MKPHGLLPWWEHPTGVWLLTASAVMLAIADENSQPGFLALPSQPTLMESARPTRDDFAKSMSVCRVNWEPWFLMKVRFQ